MSTIDEQNIKVSVIVAVYNAEKFLRRCLESIVNQTMRDIEIICINDGSTDNSLKILEEFSEKDNRFSIFTKENEGLGAASARNLGLEKARGEYVSVLDSDDFFKLDMLEKAVSKADKTEADIVVFGGYKYDDNHKTAAEAKFILNKKFVPDKEVFSYRDCADKIFLVSAGMAWNKLFRRSFLKKHNLKFQKVKYTDDAYFTFAHMILADKIAPLKECLCYYRVNTGVSQTDGITDYPDSAYAPYVALKKSFVEWGIYDEIKRSFVNYCSEFMRSSYDKIERYESFKYLHDKYRYEIFDELDISGHTEEYFYDKRIFMWIKQVLENSAEETAFKACRAYGNKDLTTGALRFLFPYEKIPVSSKVALLGAGIMSRHYCSQVIIRNYCDVVVWADENPSGLSYIKGYDELKNIEFDYVLVAYEDIETMKRAVSYLKSLGVQDEKIILGGMER